MSLTSISGGNDYVYVINFGGTERRAKRDGRAPSTGGLVGDYSNGYDVVATFGGQSYRAKRKGRNPSTSFYPANQSTGVVADNYELPAIGGHVVASIDNYESANEIEDDSEV